MVLPFRRSKLFEFKLYRDIDRRDENPIQTLELVHNLNGQTLVLKPGASKRKFHDIFLFHKKFDMLEMRLIELENVVDCFVTIEPPHTIAGTPQPLHFKENDSTRFTRFMKKNH